MEYELKGVRLQDGRITNIGTVGALLITQQAIPIGTKLVLHFRLPLTHRPIQIACTVKWAEQQTVGVEFAQLTLQEQAEIWKYHAKETARQRNATT